MDHRERMIACLQGEMIDRPPVSFWRHFPVDDQTPEGLAAATMEFQKRYDFDFIKVTPASSFCIKDYGVLDEWRGSPEGTRDYTHRIINSPDDWKKLTPLHPNKGYLADQVRCLRYINDLNTDRIPVIQTIFSPLAQAKNLVGQDKLLSHLRMYPDAVLDALAIMAKSTMDFIEEIKTTGIDGIFFAVQFGQSQLLSPAEFDQFEQPFDLQVLSTAQDLWMNLVHLHGENIYFNKVADWQVHIINWHDRHTPPDLGSAAALFPGAVCGGVRRWETMVLGTPELVTDEAIDALRSTAGRRTILGSGCVLPVLTPTANILAARQSVELFSK
ncbi:MAG: uroporphyrinogen decarboxylase [Anaerolineae bacterium]|jgi:uroporphyrinogen decarboxylase|nr:uroporphyrinogen decarboxylase [Anaerolineae bacterium]